MGDTSVKARSGKREIVGDDDSEQPAEKNAKIEEPCFSSPPTRCSPEDSKQLQKARNGEVTAKTKNGELTTDNSCLWDELNDMRKVAETAKNKVAEVTLRNHELSSEVSFIRALMPPLLHLPTPLPDGIPPTHLPPPQIPQTIPVPSMPKPSPLPPSTLLPPSPMSLIPPPPPTPLPDDVRELQQKVREWQEKYRDACQQAREAEERAKQSSSAMIKTSLMLAEAQRREEELTRTVSALNDEKEGMRKIMEETITKNVSLVVARQLKTEENQQQNFIDQLLPKRRSTYLFTIGDPIDLFQLCRPDGPESISLDDALGQMEAKFAECGEEWWRKYCNDSNLGVKLACRACEKKVIVSKFIIEHFVGQKHVDAVRARGAAVSLPALQHWLRELQLAADAASCVQQAVADVGVKIAAPTAASEDNNQN